MKKNIFIIIFILTIGSVSASSDILKIWNSLLKDYKIPTKETQSFCLNDKNGKTLGKNIYKPVRIASISKIITTYALLNTLGPDFKFETKIIHDSDNNLHILGARDPFWGPEKVYYLLSRLNQYGIYKINNLIFDERLIFHDTRKFLSYDPIISKDDIAKNLKTYFNTLSWDNKIKLDFKKTLKKHQTYFPNYFISKDINFSVNKVIYKNLQPIKATKVFIYRSSKLLTYLKKMNVNSVNFVADRLFEQFGTRFAFNKYIHQQLNVLSDDTYLYTGSGLNTSINGLRRDNYASCASVLKIFIKLKELVDFYDISFDKLGLENILAVPGIDLGTFKKRLTNSKFKDKLVAKTGSLYHTSALAGAINSDRTTFFAIFNQNQEIWSSRKLQDKIVDNLFKINPEIFNLNYNDRPFTPIGSIFQYGELL